MTAHRGTWLCPNCEVMVSARDLFVSRMRACYSKQEVHGGDVGYKDSSNEYTRGSYAKVEAQRC